jgi:cytosine/adenosine deaminase-related metal-dependent hydrolase
MHTHTRLARHALLWLILLFGAVPLQQVRADTICANQALTPPVSGTCSVVTGSTTSLLKGDILAPNGLIKNGEIVVDANGTIACAACDCSAAAGYQGATRIECAQGLIAPGLIDSLRFITFEQNDPAPDSGERYENRHDWRVGQNGHTKILAVGGASTAQKRWGELRALMAGTTSMISSGSSSGLVRNLASATDQIGLGQAAVDFNSFPLGDSNGVTHIGDCSYPAIISPPDGTVLDMLVSEGIDAAARNEFLCVSGQQLNAHDLLANASVMRGIAVNAVDTQLMHAANAKLIWSPRSNISLYGNSTDVRMYKASGVPIALGTDWIRTGSLNLQRELKCADELNQSYYAHAFSDRELADMVTVNGARAAQMDDVIGKLEDGKVADITIFNAATHSGYRALIDAEAADVVLVMRGGKVLYGDDALLSGLSLPSCDPIDVCGTAKRACLLDETGQTFAQLQVSVGSIYLAFACGIPANERTCKPQRGAAVNDSTIYSGEITALDSDGDGIVNAIDNCPAVFNPIRPFDNGAQADFDADGVGDSCDACPNLPGTLGCVPIFMDGFE